MRPGSRKTIKVHQLHNDQPLCGVRRSGEWQVEFPLGLPVTCARCLEIIKKAGKP
jgi:hypothetical protein